MTISSILKGGIEIGLKNFLSLVGALILYILTIWIPYLNVGTTIAMFSIPAALSRGQMISPTEIFDAKYRKNMGNFFLLMSFMSVGFLIGYIFLVIPGIVLSYSWCLALLLLVDKGMNPMQALSESNERTYGHKWTIFFSYLALALGYMIINSLISYFGTNQECLEELMYWGGEDVFAARWLCTASWTIVLQFILILFYVPFQLGILAEVYKHLGGE